MLFAHLRCIQNVGQAISRRALPLLLLVPPASGVHAFGQSQSPRVPTFPPASTVATASQSSVAHPSRRAEVAYQGDLLTVVANNTSLNQILREIGRQTGMKIIGGVAEDRVFGTYGPASPAAVLATLLDGTGSNLLIVQNQEQRPIQLVLTPRTGGVTPANPNATGFDDTDNAELVPPQPVSPPPIPANPTDGNSRSPFRSGTGGVDTNPAATSPSTTSQQLVFPPADATTTPATATITPTTPDASTDSVKTPQQIFEQLQKLRQQQTQQPKQ